MTSPRLTALRWWACVVVAAIVLAYGASTFQHLSRSLDASRSDTRALADQVRSMGGTPVAGPSGNDGKDGKDGDPGTPGADGKDGTPGATGQPGKAGATGKAGADGKDGADGKAGDVGPTGAPGDVGPAGPAGPPGEKGDKGEQGDVGESVMCRTGYTPVVITLYGPNAGQYEVCRKEQADE